jgi:hypothetical protein
MEFLGRIEKLVISEGYSDIREAPSPVLAFPALS